MELMWGGEDGLPAMEVDNNRQALIKCTISSRLYTTLHCLVPGFENAHSGYGNGRAEKLWDLERFVF